MYIIIIIILTFYVSVLKLHPIFVLINKGVLLMLFCFDLVVVCLLLLLLLLFCHCKGHISVMISSVAFLIMHGSFGAVLQSKTF